MSSISTSTLQSQVNEWRRYALHFRRLAAEKAALANNDKAWIIKEAGEMIADAYDNCAEDLAGQIKIVEVIGGN